MTSTSVRSGLEDLSGGARRLPLAWWMASKDMETRYARTVLGPFWSVLSSAIFVCVLGFTYGAIFRMETREFLPYLAVSMAFWGFINSMLNDSPHLFQRAQGIITTYSLPLSLHAHRLAIDKMVLLFHSLLVYGALCLIFPHEISIEVLLVFPALLIYYVFGIGASLLLGVLGVRWRDIAPAISSTLILIFLLTPILWKRNDSLAALADFNPFYHMIEIGRGPLQGYAPTLLNWGVSISFAGGLFVVGILVFCCGRRQIFYWI